MTNKKTLKQLAGAFISYPPPTANITIEHHLPRSSETVISSNTDLLEILQRQIDATNSAIEIITKRQRVLQQAIARCEAVTVPTIPANGDGVASKSTKSKGARPGIDDRACGWERRLIWDDQEVQAWEGDPGDEGGCTMPRRRCDRHQG